MKLPKKSKSYSALFIFIILIFLSSNLNSSIPFFQSNQIEVEFLDINKSHNLFDGMEINYTYTFGVANPTQFIYTNISDSEFHVDCFVYESGFTSHGYWDVDVQTRVMENSGGGGLHFENGYHTPIWIMTNVSIGDQILIVVDGEGDHLFEVSSELIYEIPGIGPVEVWILEDLNVSGGVAWYEKSTGILLYGLFYFDDGNNSYKFDFVNTNAVFNFTQDYELGVSLEIPKFCEVNGTYQINATVSNYGVKDVFNINLSLYLDGINVISSIILNLPSKSNDSISYYWTPISYGEYNFTAYTPPIPSELLLENNYATKIIPLHQVHLFDGINITYTSIRGEVYPPMHLYYSYVSGNKFHVDWVISNTTHYAYWDVDAQTRVMENSGGTGWQFGDGYHTPFWIFTNVSVGDNLYIAVDAEGDHLFEITSDLIYEIPDIGPVEVWVLEDLNISGGFAWYEKSTGILLNCTFYYGGGAGDYKFEFINTNGEFIFMHDYELGISLKYLKIPTLLGIELKLQINTTVSNYGLKDMFNINISLYLDGIIINSFFIVNLSSGSSETNTFYWIPLDYGVYNFSTYVLPIHGEPYLYNNYVTKIVKFPPTRINDGMYIYSLLTDLLLSYPSNVSYHYSSDNIFWVYWHLVPPYSGDSWWVDSTTREITGSYYFTSYTHTPFWISINVSLGDIVLISVPYESDHEFMVTNKLIYDLPNYGPVEVLVLQDIANPDAVVWYEKSTGILLNGTFFSVDGVSYYVFDFFSSNARFTYVYPPSSFELTTDADTPYDSDGEFKLFWTTAFGAINYTVYQHTSPITVINDTLTTLVEDTTDLQLNLTGYTDGTYYFIVVAYNDYGERKSNCIEVNIQLPQLPEPFNLATDADTPSDSDGEFNLFWSASAGANNYSVYQYTSPITVINDTLTTLIEGTTDLQMNLTGYTDGTYYFIVVAYNDYGERKSNCIEVNVETPQGPEPFNLTTDADTPSDGDGEFNLLWTVAVGALTYTVYQHSSPITVINHTLTTLIEDITDLQFNLNGYADGTYYFIVVAKNDEGNTLSNCIKVIVEIPTGSSQPSISSYPLSFIGIIGIAVILLLFKKKSRVKLMP